MVGVYGVKANATTAEVDKVNSVETVVTEVARNKKKPMETKIANFSTSIPNSFQRDDGYYHPRECCGYPEKPGPCYEHKKSFETWAECVQTHSTSEALEAEGNPNDLGYDQSVAEKVSRCDDTFAKSAAFECMKHNWRVCAAATASSGLSIVGLVATGVLFVLACACLQSACPGFSFIRMCFD